MSFLTLPRNGPPQREGRIVRDPVANSICMNGGTYFNFEDPANSIFTVADIAHALSHICRFTGHVRQFYSVAQHSVLVSYRVPPEHAYAALMHDAAEAFIGDVSTPLKRMLPDYKAIERRVEEEVFRRFAVPNPLPACVKRADLVLLATERRDLMPHLGDEWHILRDVEPLPEQIEAWSPMQARKRFLDRFVELA